MRVSEVVQAAVSPADMTFESQGWGKATAALLKGWPRRKQLTELQTNTVTTTTFTRRTALGLKWPYTDCKGYVVSVASSCVRRQGSKIILAKRSPSHSAARSATLRVIHPTVTHNYYSCSVTRFLYSSVSPRYISVCLLNLTRQACATSVSSQRFSSATRESQVLSVSPWRIDRLKAQQPTYPCLHFVSLDDSGNSWS